MLNGYIKIDKEKDYTSSDCDAVIKKQLDVPKAGHLGTLDPFATGLLIIAVNEGTKMTPFIRDERKEYLATLKLGEETPSLDTETQVTKTKETKAYSQEEIDEVLRSFLGKQKQIPPLYSAKHYKGKKAYFLAREGSKITLPEIDIEIFSMEKIRYDKEDQILTFRCEVSKGTYIRTLGSDIAKRLGTIGYLLALRRTKIGDITLNGSVKAKEARREDLIGIPSFFPEIKRFYCDDALSFRVNSGQTLKLNEEEEYLFMMHNDVLLALYKKDRNVYHCFKGFKNEERNN